MVAVRERRTKRGEKQNKNNHELEKKKKVG